MVFNRDSIDMASLVGGPLHHDENGNFVDKNGRKVTLKGINLDASSKLPASPYVPSDYPASSPDLVFWDGDNVSFVGRPFPLEEAEEHILRIKSWGYTTIRYIVTWEALEHEGPGKYDDDFIAYTAKVLEIIYKVGGLYVFIDPHQDVWSRFSGGSGAPLWTFYAAGLNPKAFEKTQAAILHNFYPRDPDAYPKMLWPSNYFKLAAGTMFTLFFCGKILAPQAVIDDVNIQTFLQDHFVGAYQYLLQSLMDKHPEFFSEMIFGFEMLNEPSMGFLGKTDFNSLPESQRLRVGPTPTFYEALKLGMGYQTSVDEYEISITGPRKTGQSLVDPEGTIAWLISDEYDKHYGWRRDVNWKLGNCLWAQHGVWDPVTKEILNQEYFSIHPQTGVKLDFNFFINNLFVDFYINIKSRIRSVIPNIYIFLHPVVLQPPPKLVGSDLIDNRIIYAPHYYDGMSLMFKTWNKFYNVDTLGIVRDKYINPVFAIVLGENNIRKCICNQFKEIKREGEEFLGKNIPIIMTETGMPFDMDNKKAFTNGDYSSQTSALDALGFALEGSDISHTWWVYSSINSHKWGDHWNCEDFSFYSNDDRSHEESFRPEVDEAKRKLLESESTNTTTHELTESSSIEPSFTKAGSDVIDEYTSSTIRLNGVRAAEAVIRPYALKINGIIHNAEFNLKNKSYKLVIYNGRECLLAHPTVIYLPKLHFNLTNNEDLLDVRVSSGSYVVDEESSVLKWYHSSDEQKIEISNFEQNSNGCLSIFDLICFLGGFTKIFS